MSYIDESHVALRVVMSEQHLLSIIKDHLPSAATFNRLDGVAMAAQGSVEILGGVSLLGAPEPVLSKIGGAVLTAHGIDTAYAGLQAAWSGHAPQTATERAARAAALMAHASPIVADVVGLAADAAVPGGVFRLARHLAERGSIRVTSASTQHLSLDHADIEPDHFPGHLPGHVANDPRPPNPAAFSHHTASGLPPSYSGIPLQPGSHEWAQAILDPGRSSGFANQNLVSPHRLDHLNLTRHEGPETNHKIGGHVLRKHVHPMQLPQDAFDAFVERRFIKERKTVISFFKSKAEAERTLHEVLNLNSQKIDIWIKNAPENSIESFSMYFHHDIGLVIEENNRARFPGRSVEINVRKKEFNGMVYFVHTAKIFR